MRKRIKSKRVRIPKYAPGKDTIDLMLQGPATMQGSYASVGNPGEYTWDYPEATDGVTVTPWGSFPTEGAALRAPRNDGGTYDPNAPFEMVNSLVFGAPFALYDTADQALRGTYGTSKAETPAQNLMGKVAMGLSPTRWAESARQGVVNQRWVSPWNEENVGIMGDPNLSNTMDMLLMAGMGNSTRVQNAKASLGAKLGNAAGRAEQAAMNATGRTLARVLNARDRYLARAQQGRTRVMNASELGGPWDAEEMVQNADGTYETTKGRPQLDYSYSGDDLAKAYDESVANSDGVVRRPEYSPEHTIVVEPSTKQKRLQLQKPTYQLYNGPKHSVSEVINNDGSVNLKKLMQILTDALQNIPEGRTAQHRLENPKWHKSDWNTFLHTRDAYNRARQAHYPNDLLFSVLMHDAGKLWAGDGHGPYGASIVSQMFPDATKELISGIYNHMNSIPSTGFDKLVKGADIAEPNEFRVDFWGTPEIKSFKDTGEPVDIGVYAKNQASLNLPTEAAADALEAQYNSQYSPLESPQFRGVSNAIESSLIVDKDGNVNIKAFIRLKNELMQSLKDDGYTLLDRKKVINSDHRGGRTTLHEHIRDVVKTAQEIPVPKGYTRQQLVQAALLHDIGKIIDPAQGVHEQLSADIIKTYMLGKIHGGKVGRVLKISKPVIDAIEQHGNDRQMIEQSDLTQALHVADVARGLSKDDTFLTYPQLFTYSRDFPKIDFGKLDLRDELKTRINPVLKALGYKTVDLGSDRALAEAALEDRIDQHNTFLRGVRAPDEASAEMYATNIAKKSTHHGQRGTDENRHRLGINKKDYAGQYVSTNHQMTNTYGPEYKYKVGLQRSDKSKNAESLSERLLAGDFELYDAKAIKNDKNPLGAYYTLDIPYRLQTGRSLMSDMAKEDPNVPGLDYSHVNVGLTPYFISDRNGFSPFENDSETFDEINNKLQQYNIKPISTIQPMFGPDGELLSPGYVLDRAVYEKFATNVKKLDDIENTINKISDLKEKIIAQYPELFLNFKRTPTFADICKGLQIVHDDINTDYLFHDDADVHDRLRLLDAAVSGMTTARTIANTITSFTNLFTNDLWSRRQLDAYSITHDPKYLPMGHAYRKLVSDYYDELNAKKKKWNSKRLAYERSKYLSDPKRKLEFMRKKGVVPRYEYEDFNRIRTVTPNDHPEDAVQRRVSINKPMTAGQLAVIGKRGEKVLDNKGRLDNQKFRKGMKKPVKGKGYKDVGDRAHGMGLSRKTLR